MYFIQVYCLQGEMIQAKFGLAAVAERQLETYSTAVLLATESPPKPPRYPISVLLTPKPQSSETVTAKHNTATVQQTFQGFWCTAALSVMCVNGDYHLIIHTVVCACMPACMCACLVHIPQDNMQCMVVTGQRSGAD